jgi:hypothetical protein
MAEASSFKYLGIICATTFLVLFTVQYTEYIKEVKKFGARSKNIKRIPISAKIIQLNRKLEVWKTQRQE